MAGNNANKFIELVQEHERSWGKDSYSGRPDLAALLNSPVVAWWISTSSKTNETRRMATVHREIDDLDKYAARLLLHSRNEPPKKRLMEVYINQKKAVIRGVRLHIITSEGD